MTDTVTVRCFCAVVFITVLKPKVYPCCTSFSTTLYTQKFPLGSKPADMYDKKNQVTMIRLDSNTLLIKHLVMQQ